jgi:PIN like domain
VAPRFFIDQDLGRHAFPHGLRQAGLIVITLAEHYGIPRDQEIADHEWMLEAAVTAGPFSAVTPSTVAEDARRNEPH